MGQPLETQQFGGDKIDVYRCLPDYEIKINDQWFGFYTSPAAGISAAQKHILRKLEEA